MLGAVERRAGFEVRELDHKLRHTFGSHLAMRGAPARTIMELMRHTTLAMTQRYLHLSPQATRDAIRLLEGPVSGAPRGDHVETK